MRNKATWISAVALLLFAVAPLWAHHAFAAEYDERSPVKFEGKVTKWEMVNPHSWIHMDVKGTDGKVVAWRVEGGSPSVLLRSGFTKDSLPYGTEIKVEGFRAKDGANRAVGASLTYLDGRKLFLGGSAPGADGTPAAGK